MLRALRLPSASISGAFIYSFDILVFTFSLLTSFLLLPAGSTLGIWRGRQTTFVFSKPMHWLSTQMETPDSYFFFVPLTKTWLDKSYAFYLEQTQGITHQSGDKTVKPMFLWKSSFSSPWTPPHSEAGTWSCLCIKTGESTGWTFTLHPQHCTQRGLSRSPQASDNTQDSLKSRTHRSPCCSPMLVSNSAHVSKQPDFRRWLHTQDHIIWEEPVPALQGHTYTCIWSIPKTTLCFLRLTDYSKSSPL